MFFYEANCELIETSKKEWEAIKDSDSKSSAYKANISDATDIFNSKLPIGLNICVSSIHSSTIRINIISRDKCDAKSLTNKFITHLKLSADVTSVKEILLSAISQAFRDSQRNNFINTDVDDLMEDYGIGNIFEKYNRYFNETLIEKCNKEKLVNEASKYLIKDSIIEELNRIYVGRAAVKSSGHPVHYYIETDDADTCNISYKMLLKALWSNDRLSSCKYALVNIDDDYFFDRPTRYIEEIFKCYSGGAIVLKYNGEEEDDNDYANTSREEIEKLCKTVRKYSSEVLTIICLPRACENVRSIFNANLGSMTMLEIKEEFISGDRACDYLKMLARNNNVRPDKNLYSNIIEGETYLAPDLMDIYQNWYDIKLKTKIYPQYSAFACADKQLVKEKNQGNAYIDLQQMIGLESAKKVIDQALNYYKIQKLYKSNGIESGRPSMHMCFTGNPGTAKTTVARLFARIMKENGVLAKGNLVEVGRSDLVGKYVGWTADIVKKKFEEAMGSVLFIDEAYSLVDGNKGRFGDEAINTIVQEMENRRDDLIVIFAGYPNEMEEFLNKNPGLRSRIAFHVPFADYNSQELCEIARHIVSKKKMHIEEAAIDKLSGIFDQARTRSDFGNGRYVRNIIERAEMSRASRIFEMDFDTISNKVLTTITAEDIEELADITKTDKSIKIGFRAS